MKLQCWFYADFPTKTATKLASRPPCLLSALYRNLAEVLKNDNRAIFAAAAHAQRAADYLNQKAAAEVPETCAACSIPPLNCRVKVDANAGEAYRLHSLSGALVVSSPGAA